MTKYKQSENPETGETEFLFNARLLKLGESVLENSNGKLFKVVTLKFNLPDGEEVERTAICYQSNYQYGIEEFDSISHASRIKGLSKTCIARCCRGEREQTGGFLWKYI